MRTTLNAVRPEAITKPALGSTLLATYPFLATMDSSLFSLIEPPPQGTYVAAAPQLLQSSTNHRSRRRVRDGPYPGFGVEIVGGVAWFWLLEQWQALPNVLRAWKSVTVRTTGHYYSGCSIWVPSVCVLSPLVSSSQYSIQIHQSQSCCCSTFGNTQTIRSNLRIHG